ncbi:hypothetical protein V6Z11_D03G105800 [Gossypium hirsutum]
MNANVGHKHDDAKWGSHQENAHSKEVRCHNIGSRMQESQDYHRCRDTAMGSIREILMSQC